MKEMIVRFDDAVHATRAAVEEGIVPGGGVAYIRALDALASVQGVNEDESVGIEVIKRAIEEPLRQIAFNAGVEGSVIVNKVSEGEGDFGYNARENKFDNLKAIGVIDRTNGSRSALENAASIASMLLTTEAVIADKPEKEAPAMPGGMDGMGGMGGMM